MFYVFINILGAVEAAYQMLFKIWNYNDGKEVVTEKNYRISVLQGTLEVIQFKLSNSTTQ